MRRGFGRTLANLGEAATLSVLACYVVGFVIVNSYLLTYGYNGSGLFKVQYIGAGLLFLVILLLLAAITYPIFWALSQPEENAVKTPSRRRQALIVGPLLVVYILVRFLMQVASPDIRIEYESPWFVWLQVVLGIVWLLPLVYEQSRNWKAPEKSWVRLALGCAYIVIGLGFFFAQFKPLSILFLLSLVVAQIGVLELFLSQKLLSVQLREWPVSPIYTLLVSGLALLSATVLFGTEFYGHALPNFGGGEPPHVRIVLTAEGKKAVDKLGYESPPSGMLEHVRLIESNDQEYLVVIRWDDKSHGGLVQLKRGYVDSLLYLPTSSK